MKKEQDQDQKLQDQIHRNNKPISLTTLGFRDARKPYHAIVLLITSLTTNNNTIFMLEWLVMVYKEWIPSKSNVEKLNEI